MDNFWAGLGIVADAFGIISFILLLIQGTQIRQLKDNIKQKNIIDQFKVKKDKMISDIRMYISLITDRKYSDRDNLQLQLNNLFGNLEYYEGIESISDIKKHIKKAKKAMQGHDDSKLICNLTKILNVCERKVDDLL